MLRNSSGIRKKLLGMHWYISLILVSVLLTNIGKWDVFTAGSQQTVALNWLMAQRLTRLKTYCYRFILNIGPEPPSRITPESCRAERREKHSVTDVLAPDSPLRQTQGLFTDKTLNQVHVLFWFHVTFMQKENLYNVTMTVVVGGVSWYSAAGVTVLWAQQVVIYQPLN